MHEIKLQKKHIRTLMDEVLDNFYGVIQVGSHGIWPSDQSGYSVTVFVFVEKADIKTTSCLSIDHASFDSIY
jgi:hypothetical protein